MKLVRLAAVTAAVASVVIGAAPSAFAIDYSLYISRDGDLKAQSFFNSSNNRLCADLVQGSSATVSVGGVSVTDYTANGASVCTYTSTSDSNTYNMHLVWQGTSGAIVNNDRPVQG